MFAAAPAPAAVALAAPPLPPLPPKVFNPLSSSSLAVPPPPPPPPKAETEVPLAVTDCPSAPLPPAQPPVKQLVPFMPEAPTTCCARALVLAIIKAIGGTAVNKSRFKDERSCPDTPQKDIEPPIMP
jgi:hypothetical protein